MTIYEQEQLEHFQRQLLSGVYSEETLIHLYESNQLSDGQIRIIQELAPVLGGLKNVASKIGSNIGGAFKQARTQGLDKAGKDWMGRAKNAYQQGRQETQYNNHANNIGKQWQKIDRTVTNSRLFEQMEAFRKGFNGQDKYVDQALAYINSTFLDLQHYLSVKYPQLNVETDPSYTPEWKKQEMAKQAERQKSLDAQVGAEDVANPASRASHRSTQRRRDYAQRKAQGLVKPRNTLANKIRNA
jgi:seryl-tRNA synthetase